MADIEDPVRTDKASSPKPTWPARNYMLFTKSDSTNFPKMSRGISFSTAGDIALVGSDDVAVTVPSGALAAGIIHPIQAKRINSTNTTASGFVIWF